MYSYFLSASLSAVSTLNKPSELGVGSIFRPSVHRVDIGMPIFLKKIFTDGATSKG